jgi:hypothetical protein
MLPAIVNVTPFPVEVTACLDADAKQYYVIVLSASFETRPGEQPHVAEDQPAVNDVDVHFGAPGESSVKYDADFAPEKRLFDVIVNGAAYAPGGRPAAQVEAGIRIGGFQKVLVVSGDRLWKRAGVALIPSRPERFTRIPILYERAFGGCQGDACNARNPVGIGFQGALSSDPAIRSEVPNVELPHARLLSCGEKSEPAGFGVIARSWVPRLPLAGTYDERWRVEQFPLVPRDLDARFHQASPLDQQLDRSLEGEVVHAVNMTPEGHWSCRLPRLTVPIRLRLGNRAVGTQLRTDTVIVEPDAYRCTLKARACVLARRNAPPLEEVVVGEASRAWWRARTSGKEYIGRSRAEGPPAVYFEL